MPRLTIIRSDALLNSLNGFALRKRKPRDRGGRYSDDQIRELKDFVGVIPVDPLMAPCCSSRLRSVSIKNAHTWLFAGSGVRRPRLIGVRLAEV
jgi:hypothetical protein